MPLDRFVLILVIVIAAAGASVWLASLVAATLELGGVSWVMFVPVALVVFVVWRVIADRIRSAEDDHYDGIDR